MVKVCSRSRRIRCWSACLHYLVILLVPSALAAETASSVASLPQTVAVQQRNNSLIKSENDKRQYRYIVLENQFKALLVSDPLAEKAAAALSVRIGANQNPPEREGLAHFLEHMLFLGTEKYPEAGAYQAFIAQHSGTFNAYTAAENTTYFFDIDPIQLEPALDRFSQFFIAPLFTAKYVERERQAVHAEYVAKIKDDARREWEIYRELFNPEHPDAKFSVGNLTTLADRKGNSIRDELIAFYKTHYSSDLMNLVVVGRESLDSLEQMVSSRFVAVPRHDVAVPQTYPPLFAAERLPATAEIKPEKETRRLTFNFPIPQRPDYFTKKPYDYIGQLLAHQGKGSLLSFLKRLGWAENVTAGVILQSRYDALFQLNIDLTAQGVRAREQIVSLVFYALDQIRLRGVDHWRYEEMQEMANVQFSYQEKQSPVETARLLAEAMFHYQPTQLLKNNYWYAGFDEQLIKESLTHLTSDNLLLVVTAPDVASYRASKLYSAPFSLRYAIPTVLDLKPAVKQELALPEQNPFMPRSLAIKSNSMLDQSDDANDDKVPQIIFRDKEARVWFVRDRQFAQPKAIINVNLKSPLVAASAEGAAQAQLFAALIRDQLVEYAYPAKLGGVDYLFQANSRGFELNISGFSSRQNLLLNKVVDAVARAQFNEERFNNLKQELMRELRNREKNLAYQVMLQQVPVLQLDPHWSNQALIAALEPLQFSAFARFGQHMLLDAKMDMLIYGNYYRQEALKLAILVDHSWLNRLTGREMPPAKALGLSKIATKSWLYHYNIEHSDSLVELLIPAESPSIEASAHMLLLQQVLRPGFYTRLRTEKQLGYIVGIIPMPLRHLEASLLVVQSPVATEAQLMAEIEQFLIEAESNLASELSINRESLVRKLREPARSLSEQAQRYWNSILIEDVDFNRQERLADAVEKITVESLLQHYRTQFLQKNSRLWLVSDDMFDEQAFTKINDLISYKAKQDAYPIP